MKEILFIPLSIFPKAIVAVKGNIFFIIGHSNFTVRCVCGGIYNLKSTTNERLFDQFFIQKFLFISWGIFPKAIVAAKGNIFFIIGHSNFTVRYVWRNLLFEVDYKQNIF